MLSGRPILACISKFERLSSLTAVSILGQIVHVALLDAGRELVAKWRKQGCARTMPTIYHESGQNKKPWIRSCDFDVAPQPVFEGNLARIIVRDEGAKMLEDWYRNM